VLLSRNSKKRSPPLGGYHDLIAQIYQKSAGQEILNQGKGINIKILTV